MRKPSSKSYVWLITSDQGSASNIENTRAYHNQEDVETRVEELISSGFNFRVWRVPLTQQVQLKDLWVKPKIKAAGC